MLERLGVLMKNPYYAGPGSETGFPYFNTDDADPNDPYTLNKHEREMFGYKPNNPETARDEYLNALYRKANTRLIQAVGK
jgi:hypothetical protein